jgi:hypothetical protein
MRLVLAAAMACLLGLGCEEEYTECHPERAPDDFPAPEDRLAQCQAICEHVEAIGCGLGCPYLPEGGLDAGVQTDELECMASCANATDAVLHPELSQDAVTNVLRCYAGTKACRQIGACTRLCGPEEGLVWPNDLLCVASP